ncbi:MBL fold metallo-hydrolase [Haladaptatus sp. SPP-AMP-3]|uniref:MBL fold metallo-hydrolase n=1 Tax=Haladaptatus sp. SPP-AMP-3 TaxID=3121295 RepID=UPI003C2BD4CA
MASTDETSNDRQTMAYDSEVAPGVYRFGTNRVNWYVIEADGELLVVDAGLPNHWEQLVDGLDSLGYSLEDIAALILTHGHGDHIGFANRLQKTANVPVRVHSADVALVEGDSEENMREVVWNLWRPAVIGLLLEFSRSGGNPSPVETVESFEAGTDLELPATPQVIHVPGHSAGSCVLYLSDRNVLFCGDALATVDLKTGRARGPQIMPMFTENTKQAVESLDQLGSLGEVTLLPGHGDPWRGEMHEAIRLARSRK